MTYQNLFLTWQDIEFSLAFDSDYYISVGMAHIEIRCAEPLPITETGYKSIFLPKANVKDIKIAATLILQELDAQTKWQVQRQLTLFDD